MLGCDHSIFLGRKKNYKKLITKSSITHYIPLQNHPPKFFLQKQKIIMSYTNLNLAFFYYAWDSLFWCSIVSNGNVLIVYSFSHNAPTYYVIAKCLVLVFSNENKKWIFLWIFLWCVSVFIYLYFMYLVLWIIENLDLEKFSSTFSKSTCASELF